MSDDALRTLQIFIARLMARQQAINASEVDTSLVLGDALLLHALARPALHSLPSQVVIIGPTQAGKSTIVNLLLAGEYAKPSPLAGYTRHAQGFSSRGVNDGLRAATDSLLPWLRRIDQSALSNDDLGTYSLSTVPAHLGDMLVWDTPDFDSVSSRDYRATVPMLCAIADLIVMVVSREKYADQSVWEVLKLLSPVQTPTLLCVNKVPEKNREQLTQVITDKLVEESVPGVTVCSLPYIESDTEAGLIQTPQAAAFRREVMQHLEAAKGKAISQPLKPFIAQHWQQWTGTLQEELQARAQWQTQVDEAIRSAEAFYDSEFLQKPQHTDAMKKAMIKLLDLMEIPAIAKTLGRIRTFVTWPARQLGGMMKKQPDGAEHLDAEASLIQQATRHALLMLQQQANEHASAGEAHTERWWHALSQRLSSQQTTIVDNADAMGRAHQKAFGQRINDAAAELYEHLKAHPASLNSLRAARSSADAAAVVLAVKSGGLSLHDVFLAPAMLAFSTMLTEGALGQYMNNVETKLRKEQLESVRLNVFEPLRAHLQHQADTLDQKQLLNLTQAEFDSATAALEALR